MSSRKRLQWVFITLLVCTGLSFSTGCAKVFKHSSIEEVGFLSRAKTQNQGPLTVSVVALSGAESRKLFGLPLANQGIQPVWLKIENHGKEPFWLMPISVDPDYFSPSEVAYKNRGAYGKQDRAAIDKLFNDEQISVFISPGETTTGFIFTNRDFGAKAVDVDLWAEKDFRRFSFVVPVPGLKTDFQSVDFDHLYPKDQEQNLSLDQLRKKLGEYTCCTADKKGVEKGDPVNLIIVAEDEELMNAFIRRGWKQTEVKYKGSIWKTIKSFLFKSSYDHSPISPLYLEGRPQDLAMQKPRKSIHQRNHLRLWITPLRVENKPVWIGQISRDIGIRFTTKSAFFITHKIDPDVDEARDYLMQDLIASGSVYRMGYVKGVGEVSEDQPRKTLMDDHYFTDGLRLVLFLSGKPTSILEIDDLNWDYSRNR
jgi:hypothetical protein